MKRIPRLLLCVVVLFAVLITGGLLFLREPVPRSNEARATRSHERSRPLPSEQAPAARSNGASSPNPADPGREESTIGGAGAAPEIVNAAPVRTPEEWRRFWIAQVEGTANGLVEGDFRVEELTALAASLIEELAGTQPEVTDEGTLVFPIFDDDSLGSASLHTVSASSDEFELRMSLVAPIGEWMEGDTRSTEYTMSFGLSDVGELEGMGACVQARVDPSSLDPKWLEGNRLPSAGSVIHAGATESSWRPIKTEFVDEGVRYQMGEATTSPAGLESSSARSLSSLLRSLRRSE